MTYKTSKRKEFTKHNPDLMKAKRDYIEQLRYAKYNLKAWMETCNTAPIPTGKPIVVTEREKRYLKYLEKELYRMKQKP